MGNSPETGEFPAQMASNAENVSIWWSHHGNHLNGSDIVSQKCEPGHQQYHYRPTHESPKFQVIFSVEAIQDLCARSMCLGHG